MSLILWVAGAHDPGKPLSMFMCVYCRLCTCVCVCICVHGDHALARQPARNSKSRSSPALATQINAPRSNRIARPGLPRPTALRGAYADQRRARRDGRICDSINVRAFAQDICVSLIARSCPCPNRVGAFGPAPLAAEPPQ